MVVHCYLYKLRDRSDAEKARTALLRMKDHIKEIKEMKVVTEDVLRSTNPLPSDLRSMLWV